jgi:hypothetical protein
MGFTFSKASTERLLTILALEEHEMNVLRGNDALALERLLHRLIKRGEKHAYENGYHAAINDMKEIVRGNDK